MIETALTFFIYTAGIVLLLGGIVFIVNRIKPATSQKLPTLPVWSQKTVTVNADATEEEINKIMEEMEQPTQNTAHVWTTVKKVPIKTTSKE